MQGNSLFMYCRTRNNMEWITSVNFIDPTSYSTSSCPATILLSSKYAMVPGEDSVVSRHWLKELFHVVVYFYAVWTDKLVVWGVFTYLISTIFNMSFCPSLYVKSPFNFVPFSCVRNTFSGMHRRNVSPLTTCSVQNSWENFITWPDN